MYLLILVLVTLHSVKYETMRNLVLEGSRQAQAIYIYCNLLGNEAGNILYDGSVMIASQGTMLAELPRFSYHPIHLSCVDVKLRQLAKPLPRYNQKHKLIVSVAPARSICLLPLRPLICLPPLRPPLHPICTMQN